MEKYLLDFNTFVSEYDIFLQNITDFDVKNTPYWSGLKFRKWCGLRDSNSRPLPWQGSALTTELNPQVVCLYYSTDASACK